MFCQKTYNGLQGYFRPFIGLITPLIAIVGGPPCTNAGRYFSPMQHMDLASDHHDLVVGGWNIQSAHASAKIVMVGKLSQMLHIWIIYLH